MYSLTGILGPVKGGTWTLDKEVFLIGRGAACDIIIRDPTVSRRHCEIRSTNGAAHLTDLSSQSLTLVNGCPANTHELRPGDEFAVGSATFMVTEGAAEPNAPIKEALELDTLPIIEEGNPKIYLLDEESSAQGQLRNGRDLRLLFEASREFSKASTLDEFLTSLVCTLQERFSPSGLCIGRSVGAEHTLEVCAEENDLAQVGNEPIRDIMTRSITTSRALHLRNAVQPETGEAAIFTMVAPMMLGAHGVGAICVQREGGGDSGQDDLEFLVALAHIAAPFVHALERVDRLREEKERLQGITHSNGTLIGDSPPMVRLRADLARVARAELNVLLYGETGTGKELAAQVIRAESARADEQFVGVNCPAIPENLFESEFFGHERGAFTGAESRRIGLYEQAHQGILLLDEVSEIAPAFQAKLLRAVESGTFRRVGSSEEHRADVRVIATTNCDLKSLVERGEFRADLYYRLCGVEVDIPPLRERKEDITALVEHFLSACAAAAGQGVKRMSEDALEALRAHHWPGNVRELRQAVGRAFAFSRSTVIASDEVHIRSGVARAQDGQAASKSLVEVELDHIAAVLERTDWVRKEAALILGIDRDTLRRKIARYGISRS